MGAATRSRRRRCRCSNAASRRCATRSLRCWSKAVSRTAPSGPRISTTCSSSSRRRPTREAHRSLSTAPSTSPCPCRRPSCGRSSSTCCSTRSPRRATAASSRSPPTTGSRWRCSTTVCTSRSRSYPTSSNRSQRTARRATGWACGSCTRSCSSSTARSRWTARRGRTPSLSRFPMAQAQGAMRRLCRIEDDEIMGESLAERFRLEGFEVDWWRTGAEAGAALARRRYAVVISDIRLPDCSGGDLFVELGTRLPMLPPFLFMTAFGTIDRAVELLKAGAADYITKPFDPDALVAKVRALAHDYGAGAGVELDADALGVSPAMRRIAQTLPRLARNASVLLITGESGVGKEHVAQFFHRHAGAPNAPFVAVNCAVIPEALLEAELFGYEKGAFTGAAKAKRGYFEQAQGGTLFLDEIGDMPPQMQVKLLRVLQERKLQRLGGESPIAVDFRLVCATHQDLKAMVDAGSFREDLYYRIHVIHLRIPPLRERPEDIRWFVRHFIEAFNRAHPGERRRIDPRTEQALTSYSWPGNVRELKHAVERACILSPGPLLGAEAFFGEGLNAEQGEAAPSPPLAEYLMDCERDYLRMALDRHGWHMTHTAEALGITRKTLWEKLRRLGIENPEGKSENREQIFPGAAREND